MGARLYELTAEYRAIMDQLDAADGELPPDMEAALEQLGTDLGHKVNGCCRIVRELEGLAAAAKAERDRLAVLAQTRENAAKRLKVYLMDCLNQAGLKTYETDLFRVTVANNGRPSITWDETLPIPSEWVKPVEPPPPTADTQKAYERWKAGVPLPDGFKVSLGQNLRIR